jgi:hypothetical protein
MRVLALAALAVVGLCTCHASGCSHGGGATPNAIQRENASPGSEAWQFWRVGGDRPADDAGGQIKGYASATSVDHGETITFHVSVTPPQPYTIEIYRIGWYGGAGGRLLTTLEGLAGTHQPDCPIDAVTGLVTCPWAPSAEVRVPESWTTGVYLAVLRNAEHFANVVPFVVRDDAHPHALLYQQSVTTYQAYNLYPDDHLTGKSLYGSSYGPPTVSGGTRAVAVSFDRPYAGDGAGDFLKWEVHFIRWLERAGYDVGYSTDLDTHQHGERLRASKAFLVVGHDEYWSREMFDAVEAARDAGVHLGFFGANAAFWQVRFSPSASGARDRIMTCYKDAHLDPVQGPTTTVNWRSPPVDRPEQRLIGVQYSDVIAGGISGEYADYVVVSSASWVYADTGFTNGSVVRGILGYETDRFHPEFLAPIAVAGSHVFLSASPFTNFAGQPVRSSASIYQAPSRAWVFAAGTIGWSLALDDFLDRTVADPRIQKTTANILDAFTRG